MKLPAFESLDEKMEIATELHYKTTSHVPTVWAVTNFKSGFNAGVIERDKQWQSKVSKLVEALEEIKNHKGHRRYAGGEPPEDVRSWTDQLWITANNSLAEFYAESYAANAAHVEGKND